MAISNPTRAPDEAENPNPNGGSQDATFVGRPPGGAYDDIVTWIPLPVLVQRLVAAGKLP